MTRTRRSASFKPLSSHHMLPLCLALLCGSVAAQQGTVAPGSSSATELLGQPTVTTVEAEGSADDSEVQGGQGQGASASQQGFKRTGQAVAQLQRFASGTRSASGRFVQTQLSSGRGGGASAKGQFAFSRPGNFRWEIESPDQQLIITDGSKLHFYDKDLQQVTIRDASESIQATPAAVLFGVGDLKDSFTLSELGSRGGVAWVEAVPKKADSGFDQIRVGLRDGVPVVMEVVDAFGQINRFEFADLKRDVKLPAGYFQFTPPKGVDVLE